MSTYRPITDGSRTASVEVPMEDADTVSDLLAAGLPDRIVIGANGAYWRDYGTYYSMCPVSTDNDPVEIVAAYERLDRPTIEWLVDDSIRRGAISVGRGAEILGVSVREMQAIGVRFRDEDER
jgi:hypothetical protein